MKDERIYLVHIRDNIHHVLRLAKQGKDHFLQDVDTQAASLYFLQTLSESTTHLSDETRAKQPQIPWEKIRGFRNIVVHGYLSIDLDRVWLVIEELPTLLNAIEKLLQDS